MNWKQQFMVFCMLMFASLFALANSQSSETGYGGAAATVDERATEAALNVLRLGGNAVDATVAAAAVLNVTDPFSAGIGGGGFMLVYLADEGRVVSIDGRETAPAAATPDMFKEDGENIPFFPERMSSGLAVGVPGTLASWDLALARYGSLDFNTVLQPAIQIAEQGFDLDSTFISQLERNAPRFAAFPSTAALYFSEDGSLPEVGDMHLNPELAETFRLIAEQGIDVFYRGEIGEDLVSMVSSPQTIDEPPFKVRSQNMTMADLDSYNALVRDATMAEYRGYEVYGMGPPSSGGLTVGLILNMLETFDLGDMTEEEALHHYLEASRLAYSDRGRYMADRDYVNVPMEGLLSDSFAAERASLMSAEAANSPEPGNPFAHQSDDPSPPLMPPSEDNEGMSTSHITVADQYGNVVSYTITIESTGGSGMVVPGRGFLLNNELTDFSTTPGVANSVEAGKRPRSSMSPTIVLKDGEVVMALGSPGGSTIITTVTQTIMNVIDLGMSLPDAIDAPRLSQRNSSTTSRELELIDEVIAALEGRGQAFRDPGEIGAATGVFFNEDGSITAAAEKVRRGGGHAGVVSDSE